MAVCSCKCPTYRRDSIQHAWEDIRACFGPGGVEWSTDPDSLSETDVATWAAWALVNGKSINDVDFFGKWFIWKLMYGTNNYGNLPSSRIRDHEGISCVPCPYSLDSSDLNTRLWLGLDDVDPIPTRNEHGEYYMRVSSRGSRWGFECTYSGCVYYLNNNKIYFNS